MESIERSSHKVVVEQAKRLLCDLLADPFLSDIFSTATHDEVASQLSLEQGRAITVHVRRFDDQVLSVIVLQGATVGDLIRTVQRSVMKQLSLAGRTTPISWRSVWRRYALSTGQTLLSNRKAKLVSLGIGNRSEVQFVKKLRLKNDQHRH
ncbi:U11/U12 small nuclear ribonucleoprotein 25 kDa protein-like isoform X1 [Halichondria panicea]|uniref:U11/U12 small nuclear ribonucleoprotein 25 kDa protein-like isoform X1 n=1 Tax=Halichondria panicea TaxID=6063 RepID=UPI00312B36C3